MPDANAFRSGFIAIVGAPNVGKSTLLNAMLGTKLAIVSPKPQTTRHRLLGVKNLPQAQLVFLDTPGIHQPHTRLNQYMMQAVSDALADPDIVLYLTDVSRQPYPDLAFLRRYVSPATVPIFWVLNKIDLIAPPEVLPIITAHEDTRHFAEVFPLSAQRGDNVPELLARLVHHLPEGPRYFPEDMATDRDERFLIAEAIREQVFLHTHQEVPYAVAVAVETLQEHGTRGLEVEACIVVEKASQKGILVGHRGRMIKTIGTQARLVLQHLFHCPVHVRLFVRVEQRWRERDAKLRDFGFGAG